MLNTKVGINESEKIISNNSPLKNIEMQSTQDIIIKTEKPIQSIQDQTKIVVPSLEFSLQYPLPLGNIKVKLPHNQHFIFSKNTGEYIGQFEINDIFTLIKNYKEQKNIQMPNKDLIEMTIITSTPDKNFKINSTSPFMNDIDLLIELNKIFQKYEESQIQSVDIKLIRGFICMLIEHTLNTISIISKKIKDSNYDTLKNKLMRYSTGLVYKLTYYIQLSIISSEKQYSEIKNTVEQLQMIENKIEQKITSLEKDGYKKN